MSWWAVHGRAVALGIGAWGLLTIITQGWIETGGWRGLVIVVIVGLFSEIRIRFSQNKTVSPSRNVSKSALARPHRST